MGIHCEIKLFKPSDGAYVPGSTVSGVIKYALDEETEFKNVIVSLKGTGLLVISNKHTRNRSRSISRTRDNYVDIDHYIVQNQKKASTLPIGCYETEFSFTLPYNLPASLNYVGHTPRFNIKCKIQHYIRIKFVRTGLLNFDKRFKKEISVVAGITPKLPAAPVMFGESKTLTHLFSNKKSVVDVKAVIQNCVIKPGDKIEFECEITNDSKVTVKAIETKLYETYTFTRGMYHPREVKKSEDVTNTDSKTGSLKSGETKSMTVEIDVPTDRSSLENSKIVSRDYVVRIIAELPLPHRNAVLDIPVQIGDTIESIANADGARSGEQPPSYWEVMGEEKKVDDDGIDDEGDGSEGTVKMTDIKDKT